MTFLQSPTSPRAITLLALCGLLWTLVGVMAGCDTGDCYYCGSYYHIGDRFRTFDLCNECQCVKDRVTGLGRVECGNQHICEGYCYSGGKKYSSSETFTLDGQCVRCSCAPTRSRRQTECGGMTLCFALQVCDKP